MKDISGKAFTQRRATAQAVLHVKPETIEIIRTGRVPKGDPLPVAKVAAIQAAKNTSQLIPYCHPLALEYVNVTFKIDGSTITVTTEVSAFYKTGVEMEALLAVGVATLTLYDMLKAIDPNMEISGHRLIEKTGGKSDRNLLEADA